MDCLNGEHSREILSHALLELLHDVMNASDYVVTCIHLHLHLH